MGRYARSRKTRNHRQLAHSSKPAHVDTEKAFGIDRLGMALWLSMPTVTLASACKDKRWHANMARNA